MFAAGAEWRQKCRFKKVSENWYNTVVLRQSWRPLIFAPPWTSWMKSLMNVISSLIFFSFLIGSQWKFRCRYFTQFRCRYWRDIGKSKAMIRLRVQLYALNPYTCWFRTRKILPVVWKFCSCTHIYQDAQLPRFNTLNLGNSACTSRIFIKMA